jgi:hypothetical protein
VGDLPGEVLLVFTDGKWMFEDSVRFEWISLGDWPLIKSEAIPKTKLDFFPCYGAIHRTVDYLDAEKDLAHYKQPDSICIIEGTKIGGVPKSIQDEDTSSFGKFLCAFGSIEPTPEKPWPWLNVEAPFDYWAKESKPDRDKFLMWGDAGSFYIFMDSNGKLNCSIQGY